MSSGVIKPYTHPWSSSAYHGKLLFEDRMKINTKGTLSGDAYMDTLNGYVRLTRAVGSILGFVIYTGLFKLESFICEFQFWAGGGNADETGFSWGRDSNSYNQFQISFDEYNDRIFIKDPVQTMSFVGEGSIDNSTWHTARIIVGGAMNKISVSYDGAYKVGYMNYDKKIPTTYMFLKGRTGGGYNEHRVRNFKIFGLDNDKVDII